MDEKIKRIIDGMMDSLTEEQKEKANACETLDELMRFAGKEGIELPDEALDAVAGGKGCDSSTSVSPQKKKKSSKESIIADDKERIYVSGGTKLF